MRKLLLAATTLLAGCSTAPISYTGNTPSPAADTYSCAMREINRLGYVVSNTDRDGGFITAEKQTSGMGTALLTGQKYASQITVAVFSAEENATTLRVTAGQSQESALGFGSASKTGIAPSDQGKTDAQAILKACSEPAPVPQVYSRLYVVEGQVHQQRGSE